MTAALSETTNEVVMLGLSAHDVEALLAAMASLNTPSPAPAHLEVLDLSTHREIARGPFAMPAVAAA